MTRIALLTLSLTIGPIGAMAQVPFPPQPPAAPMPVQAPMPAPAPMPMAVPVPPLPPLEVEAPIPPLPPVPPMPVHVDGLDFHMPFEFVHDFNFDFGVDSAFDLAQVTEAARASAQDAREQVRAIAAQAREITVNTDMKFRMAGDAYNSGLNALQQRQYDRAVEAFNQVVATSTARVDAALYWKAFAEFRLARTEAALRTIAQLQKEHAQSRYLNDARVLETEVRKQTGQTVDPAQLDNDDIKLLAIQGLQRTEQVVPLLEGVLNAANSLNVKKRALYVLALGSDPRAREVLMRYAKGGGNPDLQMEAVRHLVSRRDTQTTGAVLRDLYDSNPDPAIRRVIIDAYGGLRGRQPGEGGLQAGTAPQELVALYQRETDADLRRQIVGSLVALGAMEQVGTLIRTEKDPRVRERAISALAGRRSEETTQTLVAMYASLTDAPSREAIINGLGHLQAADALIALARSESNLALKTRLVRQLSEMAPRNKAAADFLMDVIK